MEPPAELNAMTLEFVRQIWPGYPFEAKSPEVKKSRALGMGFGGGKGSIATRKVAFLISDGVERASVETMKKKLGKEGAEPVLIGTKVGPLTYGDGSTEDIGHTYLTDASVLYDALYTPSGKSVDVLLGNPDYFRFVNEGYRHCKAIAFAKGTEKLAEKSLVKKDRGVVFEKDGKGWASQFVDVMRQHRVWDLEEDRKVPC